MSKSYVKNCDYCKEKIEMSDKDGGRWLPYNLDNGPHDCRNKANGKDANVTADNSKDNDNNYKKAKKEVTLQAVQKKLESIGITIDLDKLMNQN